MVQAPVDDGIVDIFDDRQQRQKLFRNRNGFRHAMEVEWYNTVNTCV